MNISGKSLGFHRLKVSGHWKIALAAGILLHILAFATLRIVTPTSPIVTFPEPFLLFPEDIIESGSEPAAVSYGDLFDPAPLFLPTLWNYAPDLGNLDLEREIEPLFEPFDPVITLSAQPPDILAREVQPSYSSPRQALQSLPDNPFSILGRRQQAIIQIPQRAGFMEVQKAGSGILALKSVLPDELAGVTQDLFGWVIFQIVVDISGPIGEPHLIKGSGSPETDQILRNYLAAPFLFSGLKPGYYRVTFGP